MLGAPLVYLLLVEAKQLERMDLARAGLARRLAILGLSFAYATTLVSFAQKPFYLANNLPALFAILLLVTYLALTSVVDSAPHPASAAAD
jgi:hypothetical protein